MRTKLTLYPLVVSLLLFMATSCQAPKELVYRDFKNLTIDKVGFAATSLRMELVYYNPNNFGLQLKSIDVDIFVNNNFLGHSTQEYQITIPKLAEFNLPVVVDLDMKNLLKNALPSLLGKQVLVKVVGKVKLGKANVYKTFPVSYESLETFTMF